MSGARSMNLIHVDVLFPSEGLLILVSTPRDVELHLCASNCSIYIGLGVHKLR